MKTQAGLRLSVETWQAIRIAAMQNSVSASNLMDALAAEWLMMLQLGEPWAKGVLSSALERQRMTHKGRISAHDGDLSPQTAQDIE